jgi:hypothetical protein
VNGIDEFFRDVAGDEEPTEGVESDLTMDDCSHVGVERYPMEECG